MRIRWLGHAAFEILINEKKIYIDPWISGNPRAPIDLSDIRQADFVIVTHDHFDHYGDAKDICKNTGAKLICLPELAEDAKDIETVMMNFGSFVDVGGVEVAFVPAIHTCSRGMPAGVLIRGENKVVYHAGDTALFGDMRLIGEIYKPTVALLPIGGVFTMGVDEAVIAVELLKPQIVIPMHYGTFPTLTQSACEFAKKVKEKFSDVKVKILEPGDSVDI